MIIVLWALWFDYCSRYTECMSLQFRFVLVVVLVAALQFVMVAGTFAKECTLTSECSNLCNNPPCAKTSCSYSCLRRTRRTLLSRCARASRSLLSFHPRTRRSSANNYSPYPRQSSLPGPNGTGIIRDLPGSAQRNFQ